MGGDTRRVKKRGEERERNGRGEGKGRRRNWEGQVVLPNSFP